MKKKYHTEKQLQNAIEKMRIAGRLAAQVLDMITPYVKSGVSTDELDKICHTPNAKHHSVGVFFRRRIFHFCGFSTIF
jgi:methionine aminopeptidase